MGDLSSEHLATQTRKLVKFPPPPLLFCQRKQRNFGLENFYLSIFPQQYWMSQLVFNDVNFITSSSRKKRLSINIFHHIYINIITTSIPSILVNKEYVYMKIRFQSLYVISHLIQYVICHFSHLWIFVSMYNRHMDVISNCWRTKAITSESC